MLVKASLKAKTIQCYLKFSLSTSRFFQYRDIRKFRRNSWHIFYILFGLMQSKHKRKELSFILELWSMIKGAVHNFHLSKTNFLHKISLMQLKKKKKFFICEHWYEKLSGRILFTMYGRGEGSDFFKALFIIPYYLITC